MKHLLPDFQDLSLAEQVAQLIVVRASGHLFDPQRQSSDPDWKTLKTWLKDWAIGGVLLHRGSAGEVALRTQELQDVAKVPLLIAADVEAGVGQRFSGATEFPPLMALGDLAQGDRAQAQDYAYQMGAYTAQEAAAIGVNWLLAPVVDVNCNPLNPVIGVRSPSADPVIVSELTGAFIQGAQAYPVLTTAKHFPGHGDTSVDSHEQLPELLLDRSRLEAVELMPFRAAIAAQVDSIMAGHLLVPVLDKLYPASLSDRVLTKLLRQTLGFEGLIVTDALVMGAIAQRYDPNEAVVLAVEAGADMVLMPADPGGAIAALCGAVEEGRIPADRILESLERIWRAKQKITTFGVDPAVHQHAWEQQIPSPIQLDAIAQPQAIQMAEDIVRGACKRRGRVKLMPQGRTVIGVESMLDCDVLSVHAPAVERFQALGYAVEWVDSENWRLVESRSDWPTVLQIFGGRQTELSPSVRDCFEKLLAQGTLQGVVVYGSPFVLADVLARSPQRLPYVFSYGQMPMAQRLALDQWLDTDE